ncbi:MAG TPA: MFS transporter [Bacillota bacterium]|nr:MFS transporter [Bacillota bacterium]
MRQENKDSKWNFGALIADGSFFSIGVSFLESNTIFPALISQLTTNSVLIGLMSTIRNAGYLLPQLFVAGYAERLPLKKPLLRINGIISRLSVLVMAGITLFVAARNPGLALIGLISANAIFALSDGIGGVPWIDMTAKVIPSNRRGRLFGVMQFIGGIGAFLAGFLIRQVLASESILFPRNYGILLSLGFLFLCFSFAGTMLVRETPGPVRSGSTFRSYLRSLPDAWRRNRLFQRMMFTRMLYAFLYLSLPFYAIFARQNLGFAESDLGFFVSAQMAGNITAGLLWGYLGDRFGNRAVVRGVGVAALLTPAFALMAALLHKLGYTTMTMLPILLLFFCIGGTLSGMWMGFTNYLLELVDDVDRPTYIGMMNTLTAPFTFLPVLGGLIIQRVSHEALFICTLAFVLAGSIMAYTLPEPRTPTQSHGGA